MPVPNRPTRPRRPVRPKTQEVDADLDDFLGEDDFEQPQRPSRPVAPPPVEDDDDPFETVDDNASDDDFAPLRRMSVPEVDDEEDVEQSLAQETYREFDAPALSKEARAKANAKIQDVDTDTDDEGRPVRVDKKKKKLLPFGSTKKGGVKKNRRLKESDFDSRKNLRKQARAVQAVVILGVLAVVGMGIKGTFFPQAGLTKGDVENIVLETAGITDFPKERARGFVKDFMTVFLERDRDNKNEDALGFFYTGEVKPFTSDDFTLSNTTKQRVIVGPEVYSITPFDSSSAKVAVGAFLETTVELTTTQADGSGENIKTSRGWTFFNVNVYYDKETDRMFVAPDSPSIMGAPSVGPATDLPMAMNPLGNTERGDEKMSKEIEPVIRGFINGYAKSSPANHTYVDQYISSDIEQSVLNTLQNGLKGEYQLKGGEDSSSINIVAFPIVEGEGNVHQTYAKVDVVWERVVNGAPGSAVYKSSYVSTLTKSSSGKWLIEAFVPYPYIPAPENNK